MFTCIACTKQVAKEGEGGARGTATQSTKEAVKSLTAQIKGMAFKISGKHCKTEAGSSNSYKKGESSYPVSSTSTPAWDFTSSDHRCGGFRDDYSRFGRVLLGAGDQTPSGAAVDDKEWMAQVEPGVVITFVALPNGGNDLRRIRFSKDMFNKWQAQIWWGENYDKIVELYNVQRFNRQSLTTPPRSEDEQRDSIYSRLGSATESPMVASRDEASISVSNASDVDSEWVEQDEPGVYITIRQLVDGTRELRRVRFSRERFGEVKAKHWWEENRERILVQYL